MTATQAIDQYAHLDSLFAGGAATGSSAEKSSSLPLLEYSGEGHSPLWPLWYCRDDHVGPLGCGPEHHSFLQPTDTITGAATAAEPGTQGAGVH
ncbi:MULTISPECIES: hypothetical protein [unclassified Streptomyces]|uniref:hypothetical protein n=1 Tax=unclassified Streptomyces TaxID=2593676 RepID=UPI002DDB04D9|nr:MULTISPECIES: hypothetical protein [unclassified Streptomyces]WSA95877.1 hypothetical protein OIE63_33225 [Streptomyces sp. NBC_01795]WSB80293.1 hypothetical protein OHB04_34335 [Streptomyces sp. NBC_01775]WSS11497.1 hypothetical protein OG533_05875 [Streptomyces sp. NBC_01186]WSS40211.1 hypothetical protein OG220_06020 [Streptomyces sp. NBC_01187]